MQSKNDLSISPSVLPADVIPFEYQIAGHFCSSGGSRIGMLKQTNGKVLKPIVKPVRGDREVKFYENVNLSKEKNLLVLKQFIPQYFGVRTLSINGRDTRFLILENMVENLKEPCIMDIKIGQRTWDPTATPEKIEIEKKKYAETKFSLGFCIPGFQFIDLSDNKVQKYGKEYGKKLNGKTAKDALLMYLNAKSDISHHLLIQILNQLWKILQWCQVQTQLQLYSTSLLVVYDAYCLRRCLKVMKQCNPSCSDNLKKSDSPMKHTTTVECDKAEIDWHKRFNEMKLNELSEKISGMNTQLKYENIIKAVKLIPLDDISWVKVKMIDFVHVFPAESNKRDENYLDGIQNLVKVFEKFLCDSLCSLFQLNKLKTVIK